MMFQNGEDWGLYGAIQVGSNVFFGVNCTVLPGTTIGSNCVIGAGSVVRGRIPDGSVVMGNPAKVVMPIVMFEKLSLKHRNRVSTGNLTTPEKRKLLRKHFGLD